MHRKVVLSCHLGVFSRVYVRMCKCVLGWRSDYTSQILREGFVQTLVCANVFSGTSSQKKKEKEEKEKSRDMK